MAIKIKKNQGFSIIETIIAIFIFALAMTLVNTFIVSTYKTHGYEKEQAQAINEARRGIDAMANDIRSAKPADNGSFAIERADDRQFVFYSDIDGDGETEKVRYYLGTVNSGDIVKECATASDGGSCSVSFSNFFTGNLRSVEVRISTDGDVDAGNSSGGRENVAVSADGTSLGNLCYQAGSCIHCKGSYQGDMVYDVTSKAQDNSITFLADANSRVTKQCPDSNPAFAMKTRFELSWSEDIEGFGTN